MLGISGGNVVVLIQLGYSCSDIISKCGVGLLIYSITMAKSAVIRAGNEETPLCGTKGNYIWLLGAQKLYLPYHEETVVNGEAVQRPMVVPGGHPWPSQFFVPAWACSSMYSAVTSYYQKNDARSKC
jgi:hypothetical protein